MAELALRSVKDEMRQNLLSRLAKGGPLFEGVIGYDETTTVGCRVPFDHAHVTASAYVDLTNPA